MAMFLKSLMILFFVEFSRIYVAGTESYDTPLNIPTDQDNRLATSPACDCIRRLKPEIEKTVDILWVLTGIVEKSQMNAAMATVKARNNRNFPIRSPDSSKPTFEGTDVLSTMHGLIYSLGDMEKNITRLGESRSILFMDEGLCPVEKSIVIYKNLSSQVTDAVHFMNKVEKDVDMAISNLTSIRLMVVEMNREYEKFKNLSKKLENMPCPDSIKNLSPHGGSRVSGLRSVDCVCVNKILPESRMLIDELNWVLQILQETEGHAMWTMAKEINEGSAPASYNHIQEKQSLPAQRLPSNLQGVLRPLETRNAVDFSGDSCPLNDLLDYRRLIQAELTYFIHTREDVKRSSLNAQHLLGIVNENIDEVTEKIEYYKQLIMDLETRRC